ncbi:MAG: FAD-dependent thymidylate synthase [Bdellovibrionales bacterium RIFOXYB1_FULL_37_110]|nr:MAG: FAD-dependent thymidylate synthase [Bdellovibrionales bacterium RIFOXYA1_FULL_38_20]OFZ51548.1 MAG: FAD-dependent thymidylate synthase [Bdellovibrionales bacterium RIFOXYC1_FULL_37_79]OFZ60382.1 MAG: FAD-dependent thymidylate synthase [Bdellovibrionales bacterium RIFOXYB1_FULL_37_110]OFZ63962.1 MAG: FAD-dependent thymidylate synthase [Bdellovibrionales bacterium RIFOXYD1_FULL_36_51]
MDNSSNLSQRSPMQEIKCLDHGFVRLVDYMGNDFSITQAARTSYGDGTKSTTKDKGLIRYLMRHRHTSPFEMVSFKFHCKMPIFVARQWIRHRTASLNEVSGRYSILPEEFYLPSREDINFQSDTNNQGRSEQSVSPEIIDYTLAKLENTYRECRKTYEDLIAKGIAREIARIVLPLAQYTEWYWKMDLHNLLHFLALRLDKHSQKEIRVYAEAIRDLIKTIVPTTWEAFEDYVLNAYTFSGPELGVLKDLVKDRVPNIPKEHNNISKRELSEFTDYFIK